jgi:hypothetical protein
MKCWLFAGLACFAIGCTGEPEPAPRVASERRTEPHPLDTRRAAVAEQNALAQELENALAAHDTARARLIAERARPWLDAEENDAFAAIAGCLERPGAESRRAGERFIAEHRASPQRRKVRHACLGARTPALLR